MNNTLTKVKQKEVLRMSSQQSSHGMTDMTQGRPARLIFFFALPLLVGNIFQQLYNMVDSIVVGRYVGTIALAAVGTGFPLIFMLSSLFMGLGIGATVMVAQYYGAQDHEKVRRTVDTIYTALVVGTIPLTVIGLLLTDPLLWLMNVPADTMADARTYVLIVFGGIVGTLGYNVNAGILQGLGDSRTPLLFLAIACVINIVLDLTFVIVFDMGVAGVAIATIIAQIFSWIFGIFYINRKYPMLQIHPFSFRFDRQLFSQLIRLGIPAGIQQALFSLGIMTLQALVNRYGADFIAGFNGCKQAGHLRLYAHPKLLYRRDHLCGTKYRRPGRMDPGPFRNTLRTGDVLGLLPGRKPAAAPFRPGIHADVQHLPRRY